MAQHQPVGAPRGRAPLDVSLRNGNDGSRLRHTPRHAPGHRQACPAVVHDGEDDELLGSDSLDTMDLQNPKKVDF